MRVQAIHLGQKIDVRRFQAKAKYETIVTKDPNLYFYSIGKEKYFVLFRYGVGVFWNFDDEEVKGYVKEILPFVQSPIEGAINNESIEAFVKKKGKNLVEDGEVYVSDLNHDIVKLVSVVLARSVILDFFEQQVDQMLYQFGEVIEVFSTNGGMRRMGSRELLRQVANAMKIQNVSVTQMAMLDKPDFTWDDSDLDKLYDALDNEYEIADRYDTLKQKLETLFHDSKFILDYLDSRRSFLLEFTIIALIMVEVVLFVYELGWM